jgi:CO dehydrogenase/acetyl-CoA synthase epsilon subunit
MTEHEIIQEAKTTMLRGGGDALRDEAQGLQKQSMLKAGIEKVASAVTSDRDMQREIGHYGSQGLKTAALFFGRHGSDSRTVRRG